MHARRTTSGSNSAQHCRTLLKFAKQMTEFIDGNYKCWLSASFEFSSIQFRLEPIDESLSCGHVVVAGEKLACRSEFIQPGTTLEVDAHQSRLRRCIEQIPQHRSKQLGFSAAGAANQNCMGAVFSERSLHYPVVIEAECHI
jgi:hypothetical protein